VLFADASIGVAGFIQSGRLTTTSCVTRPNYCSLSLPLVRAFVLSFPPKQSHLLQADRHLGLCGSCIHIGFCLCLPHASWRTKLHKFSQIRTRTNSVREGRTNASLCLNLWKFVEFVAFLRISTPPKVGAKDFRRIFSRLRRGATIMAARMTRI